MSDVNKIMTEEEIAEYNELFQMFGDTHYRRTRLLRFFALSILMGIENYEDVEIMEQAARLLLKRKD